MKECAIIIHLRRRPSSSYGLGSPQAPAAEELLVEPRNARSPSRTLPNPASMKEIGRKQASQTVKSAKRDKAVSQHARCQCAGGVYICELLRSSS